MRKVLLAAAIVGAGLFLSACSTGQSAKYQAQLATLTNNVVATNTAIAQISKSLAQNCDALQASASALRDLSSVLDLNSTAKGGLAGANAALSTWCANPPSDIASAVNVTAQEIAAAKAAYQAAKNGG